MSCILSTLMPLPYQMDRSQVIRSSGIFHGLPTFKATSAKLTAIVTGANGISGYHMAKALHTRVRTLVNAPERWAKVYCLSRRPPPDYFFTGLGENAARVEHVQVDFLDEPKDVAASLKNVDQVDHVFFFSYAQSKQKGNVLGMWSDADALAETNTALLANFIKGMKLANFKPRRFVLQTGAKTYGFHIGPANTPSFETDPRVEIESNFYYPQEDVLFRYAREESVGWNVFRPSYIIGAVRNNQLNYLVGFIVYAAVTAHLKQALTFPGDYVAWDKEFCASSAVLNAHMMEWAVLTPAASDEAFNVQDGLPFTWSRFWPYLASWYGVNFLPPESDPALYDTFLSRSVATPRGYGSQGVTRCTFSLLEWSKKPDVEKAWDDLKQKHNLLLDPFQDREQIFGITDSAVIGGWPLSLSMRKARKMGFHGTVDSYESMFSVLQEFVSLKMSPPLAVESYVEAV
ncbi:Putative NAD(P)-binding domain superfamily [Septoria linicola]|uniref:NAD(P)-binding domain superfamily n=1 Tax=Septoria linicola TaxID=215465 RepID=A0A9Q9ARR8_9PEZI|nr:Putative NAD(P)-binding domain superfamily [Septoria linicola]